ncbi:MAG: MmgE/PrpD family protein [Betaproteobacteria bacterium]|nr:MmgE/PrpD family protein [Betaproteobacteria bacterium]
MTDAIHRLASFVHDLSWSELPEEVRHACKRQILDAVTTVVAAHRIPGGVIAARTGVALAGRGGGDATIIGMSDKVPPYCAAFANSQMSISLDLTSNLLWSQGLAGIVIFTALALGEERGASGRQVLEAIACGFEVAARVKLALPPEINRDLTHELILHWTIFGAAASSAKMLGLDPEAIVNCLAMTGVHAPPANRTFFAKGTVVLSKYGPLMGNMAATALSAAMLAREGFTGDPNILDDNDGYYRSVGTRLHDRDALTEGLGRRWWILESQFKRYPAGTHNQQALHTIARLVTDHQIAPQSIRAIEIWRPIGTEQAFGTAQVTNYIMAQFSLPYQVGAVVAGIPQRSWSTALNDPLVTKIAENVQLRRDEAAIAELKHSMENDASLSPWSLKTRVKLTADGHDLEKWSEYGRVTDQELKEKFRHYAADIFAPKQIDGTIEAAFNFENLENVRTATSLWSRAIETKVS